MSIFLFGVKSLVIDSVNAFFTVVLTVVKLSVFLSTRVALTDLQRDYAISYATFFSIKLFSNYFKTGATSSSVNYLFPVKF